MPSLSSVFTQVLFHSPLFPFHFVLVESFFFPRLFLRRAILLRNLSERYYPVSFCVGLWLPCPCFCFSFEMADWTTWTWSASWHIVLAKEVRFLFCSAVYITIWSPISCFSSTGYTLLTSLGNSCLHQSLSVVTSDVLFLSIVAITSIMNCSAVLEWSLCNRIENGYSWNLFFHEIF